MSNEEKWANSILKIGTGPSWVTYLLSKVKSTTWSKKGQVTKFTITIINNYSLDPKLRVILCSTHSALAKICLIVWTAPDLTWLIKILRSQVQCAEFLAVVSVSSCLGLNSCSIKRPIHQAASTTLKRNTLWKNWLLERHSSKKLEVTKILATIHHGKIWAVSIQSKYLML